MQKGFDYTLEFFNKIAFEKNPVSIHCSSHWSDDAWFLDQEKRTFHENKGFWLIHPSSAKSTIKGTIIGGNLSTLVLLHGTDYIPTPEDIILFIESDNITEQHGVSEFDRSLQSIIHQPYFKQVKAMVIGRFEEKFEMSKDKLEYILGTKRELQNIPIIANADFGHTMPIFTFPIGGDCEILAKDPGSLQITLLKH